MCFFCLVLGRVCGRGISGRGISGRGSLRSGFRWGSFSWGILRGSLRRFFGGGIFFGHGCGSDSANLGVVHFSELGEEVSIRHLRLVRLCMWM